MQVTLMECEGGCADGEAAAVIEAVTVVDFQHLVARIDSVFERDEVYLTAE